MFSVAVVFATLILLMVMVFKRINIIIVSIVCASILAILDGGSILGTLTGPFMTGFGNYVKNFFLLFAISALFGKVMEESGAAASIAKFLVKRMGKKYAIVGVILAGAILAYGGISALVIAFTMYPIALAMFKEADLPRYLIPGVIAAGAFDFVPGAFPGTPQTVNAIASSYLGTSLSAAPALGLICGILGFGMILVYMHREGQKSQKLGHHFVADEEVLETLRISGALGDNVHPIIALMPILLITALLIGLEVNVLIAMLSGTVLCVILLFRNLKHKDIREMLTYGVEAATDAAVNTGAIVGYGAVVSASAGFAVLLDMLTKLNASPLLSFGLATTIISGAAGSGTGGLAIALETIAPRYLEMGISAEAIHRIATISSVGLDSLPHNGAIVVLLTLCKQTHKESYKQIFVCTVVISVIIMIIAIALGTMMYL